MHHLFANFANGKLHFVFIFVLENMIIWLLLLSERKLLCQIQISHSLRVIYPIGE